MKIQYKFLWIFILFLGITIFCNSKVFAESTLSEEQLNMIEEHCENIINNSSYYSDYIVFSYAGASVYIRFFSDNAIPIFYKNNCFRLEGQGRGDIYYRKGETFNSVSNIFKNEFESTKDVTPNIYTCLAADSTTSQYTIFFSTADVYSSSKSSSNVSNDTTVSQANEDVIFKGSGSHFTADCLNLYELNMTDLDDNNKKHKFNISTYTNSPCYDEIMEYYNKNYQYAIYLTDYERILTYQNYDDDNSFLYGSYVISGYIDYLITDKSFFYYSEYYGQVMSDSGNNLFNKDVEDYTKRFYFKLTYSEDSNDPHATIWENNGNLYKIDYLESFEDRYFVGSSQTIYYAKENSKGNFKDLTKDIYYLGYLNPTGGKTRDISDIPFYVYNFDYAGGTTELYVVNQSDYNYEDIIKNRYDNWEEHYDNWTILTDASTGGSYAQGNDLTSSTFSKGDVTDDTTEEEDKNHIGEIRTASGDTDTIDKKKETEASIIDGSLISNTINAIKDKFGFSNNIINNANEIKDFITNTQETHKYYLNINHKYLNGQVCIIDLSWYEPYKPTVDAFICAFAYLAFIWQMFCKIPNLISGASASSYISDIQTYKETGVGRSSNIHKGGF